MNDHDDPTVQRVLRERAERDRKQAAIEAEAKRKADAIAAAPQQIAVAKQHLKQAMEEWNLAIANTLKQPWRAEYQPTPKNHGYIEVGAIWVRNAQAGHQFDQVPVAFQRDGMVSVQGIQPVHATAATVRWWKGLLDTMHRKLSAQYGIT